MKYSVIKKYSGSDILKIFERIKKDTEGKGVLLGYEEKSMGGQKYYEVIVGIPSKGDNQTNSQGKKEEGERWEKGGENEGITNEKYKSEEQKRLAEVAGHISELKAEFRAIRDSIEFIARKNMTPAEIRLPPTALFLFKKLVARGVDRNISFSIVEDIIKNGLPEDEKGFMNVLPQYISFGNPLSDRKQKFVALVGPTGVGKTTTAAKIAALHIMSGGKIALLGTDRYRIAAVEQLKKYAEIMGTPLFVAVTEEEIKNILPNLEKYELVIVDTMGKSQYDIKNIRKISSIIREIGSRKRLEVCLLISCSQREEEIISVIRGFSEIGINYIIFTKLDETSYPGVIINIASMIEKPIAFLTVGQSVPDDIKVASPKTLADVLLGPPPLSRYMFR